MDACYIMLELLSILESRQLIAEWICGLVMAIIPMCGRHSDS